MLPPMLLSMLTSSLQERDSACVSEIGQVKVQVMQLRESHARSQSHLRGVEDNVSHLYQYNLSLDRRLDSIQMAIRTVEVKADTGLKATAAASEARYADLSTGLGKAQLYWGASGLLLLGICILALIFLRRRIWSSETRLEHRIDSARAELDNQSIQLDQKLADLLERQLQAHQYQKQSEQRRVSPTGDGEPDHALALKIADEISRMQRNISQIDPDARGIKQLAASVRRMKDNLEANGYELVDMVNQSYDPGMKVIASFRQVPELPPGSQIISRVITPQVNYRGKAIQNAHVEVSVGE